VPVKLQPSPLPVPELRIRASGIRCLKGETICRLKFSNLQSTAQSSRIQLTVHKALPVMYASAISVGASISCASRV